MNVYSVDKGESKQRNRFSNIAVFKLNYTFSNIHYEREAIWYKSIVSVSLQDVVDILFSYKEGNFIFPILVGLPRCGDNFFFL